MNKISLSYPELFSNILKRLLLLLGKLAGCKGFAVLVATALLRKSYIGEAAWTSVVVSALCGMVVPKAFGGASGGFGSVDDLNDKGGGYGTFPGKGGRGSSGAVRGSSGAGGKAAAGGKRRLRAALERAGKLSGE